MLKKIGLIDFARFFKNTEPGMRYLQFNFWLSKNYLIRRLHPWFDKKKTTMIWIPINIDIKRAPSVALPYKIIIEFIQRSSYRRIIDFCGCRRSFKCKNHPIEIGCMLMGDDARQISDKLSRTVSKEEAVKHLENAMKAGLVPIIGRTRIDDFIMGVRYTGRLLSICFCCECCCLTRWQKYTPVEERTRHSLEGLIIRVAEDECDGCKICSEHCFLNVITFKNNIAHISEDCQGCGRCATVCPKHAIKISLENPGFINDTIKKIESHVTI